MLFRIGPIMDAAEYVPIDDEAVVWSARPHLIAAVRLVAFGLAIAVSGIALLGIAWDGLGPTFGLLFGGPSIALGVLVAVWGGLRRRTTVYVLTDRAVYRRRGFTTGEPSRLALSAARDVSIEVGPIGRLLSVGDVVVNTDDDQIRLGSIADPGDVAERVRTQRERGDRS